MAVTQRITGGDEPTWPDDREPRRRRRRWPWIAIAVLLVAGGAWFVVAHRHSRVESADGLSCSSSRFRSTVIDYSWTSGPDSPDSALRAFLHSVHAKGLPTSAYVRPSLPHPRTGDVAPSVQQPFDYVHTDHGHIDVGLRIEKSGGIFEVSEVEACA